MPKRADRKYVKDIYHCLNKDNALPIASFLGYGYRIFYFSRSTVRVTQMEENDSLFYAKILKKKKKIGKQLEEIHIKRWVPTFCF